MPTRISNDQKRASITHDRNMSQQGMDAIVSGIEASGANGANGGWFQLKAELDLDLVFGVATRGMSEDAGQQDDPVLPILHDPQVDFGGSDSQTLPCPNLNQTSRP